MLRATVRFSQIRLNEGRFNRELDEQMNAVVLSGAEAMLRTMLYIVPVDTGMAQGSLVPFSRLLKDFVGTIPNPAVQAGRERVKTNQPGYPGGVKSFEAGEALGLARGPAIRPARTNDATYAMSVSTKVPHFQESEWGKEAFSEGRRAFREYVKTWAKRRVPRLKDFLTFSRTRKEA